MKRIFKAISAHSWVKITLMLLSVTLFSYLLVGVNLNSKWWIIDDHEIMNTIEDSYRLSPLNYFKFVAGSETFMIGKSPRYRPARYIIYFAETMMWGKNPFIWYLVRFIIFISVLFSCWYLVDKYVGLIMSGVFTIYLVTLDFWPDIVLRLGPSETYVILGVAIFCLSFYGLLKANQIYIYWLGIFFGTFLAVGSKENMIFMVLPLILLYVNFVRNRIKISLLGKLSLMLSTLMIFLVAYSVAIVNHRTGHDIYQQSTVISGRIDIAQRGLILMLTDYKIILPILLISLLLLVINIAPRLKSYSNKSEYSYWYVGLLISMLLTYLSQFIFYNGNWPQGNRYDFPGVLIPPFLWLMVYVFINNILGKYSNKVVKYLFMFFCVSFIFFIIYNNKFVKLRTAAKKNVERTNFFTNSLQYFMTEVKNNNGCDIVFYPSDPWSYEPIVSVKRFLLASGINNNYYVKPNFCSDTFNGDQMQIYLKSIICEWSIYGSDKIIIVEPLIKKSINNCCLGFQSGGDKDCKFYSDISKSI